MRVLQRQTVVVRVTPKPDPRASTDQQPRAATQRARCPSATTFPGCLAGMANGPVRCCSSSWPCSSPGGSGSRRATDARCSRSPSRSRPALSSQRRTWRSSRSPGVKGAIPSSRQRQRHRQHGCGRPRGRPDPDARHGHRRSAPGTGRAGGRTAVGRHPRARRALRRATSSWCSRCRLRVTRARRAISTTRRSWRRRRTVASAGVDRGSGDAPDPRRARAGRRACHGVRGSGASGAGPGADRG